MRSKKSTLLSWSIAVLSTGLLIFASLVNGFQVDQDLPLLVFLVYLVVGGLVASRRRFYRPKYDAARALESFATSVRDQTDVQRLTTELIRVVQETLEPERIVLWTQPTFSNSKIHRSELIAGKK